MVHSAGRLSRPLVQSAGNILPAFYGRTMDDTACIGLIDSHAERHRPQQSRLAGQSWYALASGLRSAIRELT
jgi:hypothetical protein